MKFNVLIQGLGCTETGARIVLKELLMAAPKDRFYWVLCTSDTAVDFIGRSMGRYSENIYLVGLSHAIFGRWLRPFLEVVIALIALTKIIDRVINLSHYGLCLGGDYVLYIHSPLLMDMKSGAGLSEGRPNRLKRLMLNTCIKNSKIIILQTRGMQHQLRAYTEALGLLMPNNIVMRPKVFFSRPKDVLRNFEFQLFYPASRFKHKRIGLAIAAGEMLHKNSPDTGLVITTDQDSENRILGVNQIGRIDRESVYKWYAGSDVLLFTSERETLGLPLLEALEAGLPIVVPRLEYAMELLGDAGCYFEQGTPSSVVAALEDCRNNYEQWRTKIAIRALEIREDAATWADHWTVFLSEK